MSLITKIRPYFTVLPILISTIIAAFSVQYLDIVQHSMPLFLGIIAGGIVDVDNRLSGRLRNLFFTLLYFSTASLAVQLSIHISWLLPIILTVAAFILIMLGAIDIRYRTIAFGTLLVMMYTLLADANPSSWYTNPLLIICGTLLQSIFAIIVHIIYPNHPVQEAMSTAYHKLSDYIMVKAQFFDPDEADFLEDKQLQLALTNTHVINAFNQCRNALFYRLRSRQRHPNTARMLQYYLIAQDIHERISSSHIDYQELAHQLEHSDLIFRIQRLIVLQAQACIHMSEALKHNHDFSCESVLKRAEKGLQAALSLYLQNNPHNNTTTLQRLIDNIIAISDQMTRLENVKLGDIPESNQSQIAGQDLDHFNEIKTRLFQHINRESPIFRHAVRMAAITAICCICIANIKMDFGYWILLTALIVCQPNYTATTSRLKQRIVGTILGVIIGSFLPYFMPSTGSHLAMIVITTTLFFLFRSARYSFSTFFITIQVLINFSLAGIDSSHAIIPRIFDTLIGSGIAWLAVSYLWPDWQYLTLGKTGQHAIKADIHYLNSILKQLVEGYQDDMPYRVARRIAHEKAISLSNTVSNMALEPEKYGENLHNGFSLLQLNYALITSISALGALRNNINHNVSNQSLISFQKALTIGNQLVALVHQHLQETSYMQEHLSLLHQQLDTIKKMDTSFSTNEYILHIQLIRIIDRLNRMIPVINQQNARESHHD